jgi:hypothetical protein
MMAWVGRRVRLAVRTAIRLVRIGNGEQVCMGECLLVISGVAPLTAAGPLRWVPALDGYRLIGSELPAWDPSETAHTQPGSQYEPPNPC